MLRVVNFITVMENQYLYWTPVTNVNALLPENAHILEYLEAPKND